MTVRRKSEPKVGIFFVVEGHVLIDSTRASEVRAYADMKTHDKGHDVFWEQLQEADVVPRDLEYDDVPRGRSCMDVKNRVFFLFVDPCVKKDRDLVDRLIDEMNLPSEPTTRVELDSHYRCPACLPHPEE